MNAILKKVIAQFKPDGKIDSWNNWPLESDFGFQCQNYLQKTENKLTTKAKALRGQIIVHSNELQSFFAYLKTTRCYICGGFGHAARNKDVNIFKDSEVKKESDMYIAYHKC